jgi:hypothetical protein
MNVANGGERLMARLGNASQSVRQALEPVVTEQTVQKALQDVQDGNINSESVALVARDVYKRTATSSMLADIEVSSANVGNSILLQQEQQNKYDLNSFSKSWDSYSKSVLSGIKDQEIKKSISSTLGSRGEKYGAQIGTLQNKQQMEMHKENLKAKMIMDTDSLNASFGVNNEEAIRMQGEIDNTLQTMVEGNLMSPNMAMLERKKIAKGAYVSNMQRGLTSAINNGTAHKFYSNFKNADHGGILSDTDIETFRQSIQSQISTDVKVYNDQLQAMETQFKLKEFDTTQDFNEKLIQGLLTTNQIDEALRTNKIDLSTHKTYTDRIQVKGRMSDDTTSLLQFRTHILDFTEDEIISSPHIKDSTKWDLIKQRRSEIGDETNWLSSQGGKEARDRIKRTFNIIDGQLMAQMDFNNQNMQDYDGLYRSFYAEVESLPPEQRAGKSISIADKYIKEYKSGKEQETQAKKEVREKKKQDGEKKKAETYGDTTGKFVNMMSDKWDSATKIWEDMD